MLKLSCFFVPPPLLDIPEPPPGPTLALPFFFEGVPTVAEDIEPPPLIIVPPEDMEVYIEAEPPPAAAFELPLPGTVNKEPAPAFPLLPLEVLVVLPRVFLAPVDPPGIIFPPF